MKLTKKPVRRLIIYFFYDADGIVDRYVTHMLEALKENCAELFIVCNGKLTPEGRDLFTAITPHILVRQNVGFDVWAYRAALTHYGFKKLASFDEIVMMNSTIMGPVYPLDEMFGEMDARDIDFWGVTKYNKSAYDPFGTISYGYIPEHIQSHFIAVRSAMFLCAEFKSYWEQMPEIKSYADAVGKHEAIFTKYFHDMGFRYAVYCDTKALNKHCSHPILMEPVRMLREYRCPFFKRRSFFHSYSELLDNSCASQGRELYQYLRDETDYDVGMIWENILRTCNMADIKNALQLDYVLPLRCVPAAPPKRRLALIMHLYYEDLFPSCYAYALSMPDTSDIIITTNTDEKVQKIQKLFSAGPWKNVKVIKIGNRGRDVSALLVGAAPYVGQYDYVCFMHDKKVTQLNYGIKGYAFSERCFHNLLGSRQLVENILALFESEPRLGLLIPPSPNHSDYFPTLGVEWGPNFDCTKDLAKKLELDVSIDVEKEPIAPLGTMFWFRPESLKKLIGHGWKYDDFPEEPIKTDGTLLHAVERIYPFVAQDAGYFTAWVLSDTYIRTEWTNLCYMLREIDSRLFKRLGYTTSHWGLINAISYNPEAPVFSEPPSLRIRFKQRVKRWIPDPIWNAVKNVYLKFGGKKWVG